MELNLSKKTLIICSVLLIAAVLSFFWISGIASSEENFTGTYGALEEKRINVTELMAVTAASSTAISILPGDAGTPIAEQLAGLSGYFLFILAAICLEKWLVTITGMLAFKIIIPISCLLVIAAMLFANSTLKVVGVKLICFALIMFALVPASVVVTQKIDENYQASIQQTIEDTKKDNQEIRDTAGQEENENRLTALFNKVKGGVSGQLDKFENTLNRITESIAVLIVTSCAIPIVVLIFFIWLVKLMTGVNIQMKSERFLPGIGRRKPGI